MERQNKRDSRRKLLAILPLSLLALVAWSCQWLPAGLSEPTQTVTPSITVAPPEPTITETLDAIPASTLTMLPPTETLTPAVLPYKSPTTTVQSVGGIGLSAAGPWLLAAGKFGLWGMNEDGSAITRLTSDPVIAPYPLDKGISPTGGYAAYITYANPQKRLDPVIRVFSFPRGKPIKEIHLTSNRTMMTADIGQGDLVFEANQAVIRNDSLAWSPDGMTLAFVGANDGETADLYTYSIENDRITRISSEVSHAYHPVWSPDGVYMVYWGVTSFGNGAGFLMDRAWSVVVDSDTKSELYQVFSNQENFIGWISDRKFVVGSWNPTCGDNNLRIVNIKTTVDSEVYQPCYSSAAVDPETTGLLFSITDFNNHYCSCSGEKNMQGLYLSPREQNLPSQLSNDNINRVEWLKGSSYFLVGSGSGWKNAYSSAGVGGALPGKIGFMKPQISISNGQWVWNGENSDFEDGIWASVPGGEMKRIFDQAALWVSWAPGGDYLYYGLEDGLLYQADKEELKPVYLGTIPAVSAAWVIP